MDEVDIYDLCRVPVTKYHRTYISYINLYSDLHSRNVRIAVFRFEGQSSR